MRHFKPSRGFTLIEVMIVVAIIAILASIAYASYSNQVIRSNRADAKATLNDTAQQLQRCYTTYGVYNNADNCTVYNRLSTGDEKIVSPEGFYDITISNAGETTYTLTATAAQSPQTSDIDACLTITLRHTGRREPEQCW